jgi:AraC family transcriptional regulator
MYDKDSTSRTGVMSPTSTAALDMQDEVVEPAWTSFHRLRSALLELSSALNNTLRDERTRAAACLQRVQAMLDTQEGTALQPPVTVPRHGLAPWQVRRVIAHIDANLGNPIRNNELAALARLSTFHFAVAFRKSVGEAPHEHIIRRRVERAQGLMLSTDKSLSDIAAECGMADQSHLTRLFRRLVGESPAAWRRARANPFC